LKKIALFAAILGLVITLITGFINTTPSGLIGASWYGYPWAWRYVPVVLNPVTNYDVANFIGDFVVWSIVASVPMLLWWKMKKK